ncbi:MAG: outer membrane protein assembly factor BamE [Pseudomonadota bacterium]|uniref:Outer membrane protein assembly factor BamE n=1 Tax=Caldimonas aquatica TaxID=376175 RepID=A0ABY6MTC6_9BURK|nr:outer membrane protein assembly factor BamE [Schlegelella aquatica]UZD55245.1 outer membrane protein assembly factor BamE [Schlegelella aquatica]
MSLMIRWGRGIALAAALGALAGCSSMRSADRLFGLITPYRIEVVQGNVVTQEMADAVQPGMSRAQVRDILGSPLLTDIFHEDRWDYIFTIRRRGTEPQQRRVTAWFEGERLVRLEAPPLPSEREFVDSIDTFKKPRREPKLALTEEERRALPAPRPVPPEEAAPPAAPRSYPPLEPSAGG